MLRATECTYDGGRIWIEDDTGRRAESMNYRVGAVGAQAQLVHKPDLPPRKPVEIDDGKA